MNRKDICFNVGTHNCTESNLFLRKFYDLMSRNVKIGWEFIGFRENKKIFIGYSSFGEMWIDYKERGKINNIIISPSEENYTLVEKVLHEAKNTYLSSLINYKVTFGVKKEDICFMHQAYNNISFSYDDVNKINLLTFNVKAFGSFDFKYVITQKINYVKHLLCTYTNMIFEVSFITASKGDYECSDIENKKYNNEWVDTSDILINNEELILSPDFYTILSHVLVELQYERELRLILNSMQQLYIANIMNRDTIRSAEYIIPGYVDLINTTLISSLEPISNIDADEPETCKACGQLKYSIRKKVKDLCQRYLPDSITKMIANELYADRSKFLHEGNPRTNEFYCGCCVPLLDPVDGKEIMQPGCHVDINMFEYVSYIIRKIIEQKFNEEN